MKISDEDKAFLIKNIKNAANLIESDDIDTLLDEIDIFMLENGFDRPNHDINDIGRKAEKIYDNIYYDN